MNDVTQHIAELLRQGRKIEAIKVLREATGVSLKEAKEAVDQLGREMEAGGSMPGSAPGPEPPETEAVREGLIALIRQNKKIEAIKLLRENSGLGLKEAKEAVERLTEKVEYLDAERAAGRETITPAHEEMLELIVQGKKMEALKVFKDQAVLDFKASRGQDGRGGRSSAKGCVWIGVFLVLVFILYMFVTVFFMA